MICNKCERHIKFKRPVKQPNGGLTVIMRSHADAEKWAWYCPICKEGYCGGCCLPKWQALKVKEGLSGAKLAAKLDSDPQALFREQPSCPICKTEVIAEDKRPKNIKKWWAFWK